MVFSSHIFVFYFLPLALAAYYSSPRVLRMPVLTLVSYLFYGWTNPWFVLLIMWSTIVDFICGNLILHAFFQPNITDAKRLCQLAQVEILFSEKMAIW
jgi:hypothetical protein